MMHIRSKKVIGLLFILILIVPLFISITISDENRSKNFFYYNSINTSSDFSKVDLSVIPEINYTALNSTWYEPKIEMLIIIPNDSAFYDACVPLMNWKNEKGLKTVIKNASSYPQSGAEQVKNLILDYYENESLKWVLLAGDTNIIPIKYISDPNLGSEPTDFFYADLNSDWSDPTSVDWIAEVYVGRLPADTSNELEAMINKTLKYETAPEIGDWMNRMLLAAGISNYPEPDVGDYDGEDEARLTQYLWQNYVQEEMIFKHMYRTTSYFDPIPTDGEVALTRNNFRTEIDNGYSTVFFAGHGSDGAFSDADIYVFLQDPPLYTDASSVNNENKTFLIYSDACSTAEYDQDGSIGEILIKNPLAGAIGYIGGLRDTYYLQEDIELKKLNRGNAKYFWMEFFENNKYQQGKALYDSKATYVYSEYVQWIFSYPDQTTSEAPFPFAHRRNLMTYNLLGDPEVDIYTEIPSKVSNPFSENIYEGQLISINLNPYAKVHLENGYGAYSTFYADENGIAKFRLPLGIGIIYNVTITGHNYVPSYFNFTTLADVNSPFPSINSTSETPTTFTNIQYDIYTNESESGIECIYSFISINSFDSYSTYFISNDYQEKNSILEIILDKLDPGKYDYSFYIFARDYANNTQLFSPFISFYIVTPLTDYILIGASILIIGFASISIYIVQSGIKKYSIIYRRMEDL